MNIKNVISASTLMFGFLTYSNLSLASDQTFQAPQFNNLGSFHHEVSTKVPLAQHFFDQGFVLFYGFEWGESIRSFKEATRLDPHCGMCYWGLALALGNIINAPLTGHEYSDAQSAIRKALSLKAYETPIEQDYIKALSLRFQHAPKISNKVGAFSCHTSSSKHDESTPKEMIAYSNAMKKITEKYPNDNDAKALYAYALFNRISWNFWDANGKINPLTPVIIKTLKSILAKDQLNIGGNHYYVHVIEQSPHPDEALDSADRLKTLVSASEHLVHMPTHIYFLTGRYHQGTESNLQAIEAFKQYNQACHVQGFEPEINYLYFHNYDFLRTTAIMEGRKKLALSSAKQIVDKPFSAWLANEPTLQWFIPIPYFVEARFGMWKELLNEPMPQSNYQYASGMWHYIQGMALAHTDHIKDVRPIWGKIKAKDITKRDVILLLDKVKERGAPIIANRTFACIRRMFNFAVERDILVTTPCLSIKAPTKENRRDRCLSTEEIKNFWLSLDNTPMLELTRLALKFQLVTAQRKGEVVAAEWSEIDLVAGWWTIPAEKAKNSNLHRVPLSKLAIELLKEIKNLSIDSQWLFPSTKNNLPMRGQSIDHALRRSISNFATLKQNITPHDLRRTAATHMTSLGISRLVVSKILNHAESGVTSIYDVHSYDKEKHVALDAWGNRLIEIIYGQSVNNIVQLSKMA